MYGRSLVVCALLAGCGRVSFGYPVVACDEVVGTETVLDPDSEHCYSRHEGPVDETRARDACASIGGHLVTITSPDEQAAVMGLDLASRPRIGLFSPLSSTSFEWITSEPLAYTGWGAPPTYCDGYSTSAVLEDTGAWTTVCRIDSLPFICEIEPWLVRDDGHAYRVLWGTDSWPVASARCAEAGGYLAEITSFDEAVFVGKLATVELWLGATYSPTSGGSWATGQPWGFAAWDNGQPNGTSDECVSLTPGQVWDDRHCGTGFRALCESEGN